MFVLLAENTVRSIKRGVCDDLVLLANIDVLIGRLHAPLNKLFFAESATNTPMVATKLDVLRSSHSSVCEFPSLMHSIVGVRRTFHRGRFACDFSFYFDL